jgi:acyl carrier protein
MNDSSTETGFDAAGLTLYRDAELNINRRLVRATVRDLSQMPELPPGHTAFPADAAPPDRLVQDIIEIVTRLSRRPVEPRPNSELLADLGFESLDVLELVGELEDRFDISVSLSALTHIRTIEQIAAEVRRLIAQRVAPSGA